MNEQIVACKEKYRPQFHFTPEAHWMNDPNGMVYYEGEYHLFYQYHPESTFWGPMHWGHAISKDMVHWEHQPIALKPDHNGTIFSGSAVVDWADTSGFFDGGSGLVAIFTHADTNPATGQSRQRQSLAYSKDKGRTWTMYDGNPVLAEENIVDFRDPKVFWHEPTKQWVMVLAVGDHVRFYTSPNLMDWTFSGAFGQHDGSHDGVWECPDLFELVIDGDRHNTKWVLIVSIGDHPNAPEGSRTQYFIGTFDGNQFVNDNSSDSVLWMDYGRDNYAGVSWSDIPESDGRRIYIGWMSNWKYANMTPTSTWRGAMTLPRALELVTTAEGLRLSQHPVVELNRYKERAELISDRIVQPGENPLEHFSGDQYEIELEVEIGSSTGFGFKLRTSEYEETVIGYDAAKQELFMDRTKAGEIGFHSHFPCKHFARASLSDNRMKWKIYVDWSSIEVFANHGTVVMTDLIFPSPESKGISFYTLGGDVKIVTLSIHNIKSVWEV